MKTLKTISGIVLFAASSITTSSSAAEFSKKIPDKLKTSSNSAVHTSLRVKDCWEPKGLLSTFKNTLESAQDRGDGACFTLRPQNVLGWKLPREDGYGVLDTR